jgi:hypothetical protein
MKAVIKSYLTYFTVISTVILIGIISIGKLNSEFFENSFAMILSTLFYSFGTLGFLVNVTTWGGVSKPEKTSRVVLLICYCLGTFFTVLSMK